MIRTVDDIEKAVTDVEAAKGDCEGVHGLEDQILIDTLQCIADGAMNPQDLAAAALKVRNVNYTRWYA
jgi:hypothetical protein